MPKIRTTTGKTFEKNEVASLQDVAEAQAEAAMDILEKEAAEEKAKGAALAEEKAISASAPSAEEALELKKTLLSVGVVQESLSIGPPSLTSDAPPSETKDSNTSTDGFSQSDRGEEFYHPALDLVRRAEKFEREMTEATPWPEAPRGVPLCGRNGCITVLQEKDGRPFCVNCGFFGDRE